jgi:hypothetical protein
MHLFVLTLDEVGIARAVVNKDIWVSEIHDVFLDRTISPARSSDEPYSTAFRQVCWSPLGLLDDKRYRSYLFNRKLC